MTNQLTLCHTDNNNSSKGGCHSVVEPPIALEKNSFTYCKGKCVSVKYCTTPADATSTTYKLTIPIFKSKNSKEWLTWVKNVERAAIGQNVTTGPAKYALAKRLLEDGAL